jgi:hypothetical protein
VDAAQMTPVNLRDTLGALTAVTLSSSNVSSGTLDDPATSGDDQSLLDDVGGTLGVGTYTLQGLPVGRYDVYVNAWTPIANGNVTLVTISGGSPCQQACGGGAWTGTHVLGNTYVVEDVAVSSGTLTIQFSGSMAGIVGGIQVDSQATTLGTELVRCTIDSSLVPGLQDVERAFGWMWATADDPNSPGDGLLYRIDPNTCVPSGAPWPMPLTMGHFSALAARTINGAQQFIVSDTTGYLVYDYDASAQTIACSGEFLHPHKKEVACVFVTPDCVWVSNEAQMVMEKFMIDQAGNLVPVMTGPVLNKNVEGLAYDWVSNVLWAFSQDSPCGGTTNLVEFFAVDPSTGGFLGPKFYGALDVPAPNLARGLSISVHNNRMTLTALHQSAPDDYVIVYDLDVPVAPRPIVYCTSGTSTNGCLPSISANANPSVSFATACNLSVANVEGQKTGLLFYGIVGPNATPWAVGSSSFLCVKSPTLRTGTQSSGGTNGACDGAFALDWNAYMQAHPGALGQPWALGNKAYVQAWYRDPPAAKTTNLSNGLELTYQP